ncbi:MAG TPA: hypothetical protein VF174_09870 [Micromonosporaceae bacterium]
MAYDAGTAYLQVVPSFRNIEKEMADLADRLGDRFGKAVEKNTAEATSAGLQQATRDVDKTVQKAARNVRKAGEEVGERVAEGVNDAFERGVRMALFRLNRDLPNVRLGADQSRFNRAIAQARRLIDSLNDKKIGVDVDETRLLQRLRRIRELFDQISRGPRTAVQVRVDADQAARAIDRFLVELQTRSQEAAHEAANALNREFDRAVREHEKALRTLAAEVREIERQEDLVFERALRDNARFDERFRQQQDKAFSELRAEVREIVRQQDIVFERALRQNEKFDEQVRREHEQSIEFLQKAAARIAEEQFNATWAGKVRKRIEDAVKALPEVRTGVFTADGRVALQSIRDELQKLSDKRIGVDIDTTRALTQIRALESELGFLARNDPDISVRVDAAAAGTQLRLIREELEKLDGKTAKIDVDGSGLDRVAQSARVSLSRLEAIIAISLSLGTVLVPAAAAAASAIGFIGTAAASAAGGIGAMVLGFSGVGEAVQALIKYEDDAKKSAASLSRADLGVAGAAAAIESAERSLANVRASNASAARRAARAVEDAQRGVRDAVRGVEDAERNLARAQADARQAQLDLNRAREEARRALQDMAFDVKQMALDQRRALLDQAEAKKELDALLANPRATQAQREAARLAYDEITLRIERLAVQQERLNADQEEANRKGVEGSDQVVAAKQRVADANERVADAQRRVQEANERVAVAQQRVADAVAAQADQQRQAAFAVAQAQQAVINAHRQAESAAVRAGVAGGEALDNLNTIMGKLSPTAQRFARFIFDLRDEFLDLRAAAADNLLPGVQSSIERLLPRLPDFRDYIARSADAVGDLFDETSKFLSTDPTWRRFFSNVDQQTVPTLERLWRMSRNVGTATVGLVNAFEPFNEDIGSGLERLTERFARWATTLDQNQGFQEFLAYVRENGPRVVKLIGEMTEFVFRFIRAAAPVGSVVTRFFIELFEALNRIPIPVLTMIASGIAAISLGLSLLAIRSRAIELFGAAAKVAATWVDRLRTSFTAASGESGRFALTLDGVQRSGRNASKGLGAVTGVLTGPWGAALTAASIGLGFFLEKQAEQKARVEGLRLALGQLGDAYRDLGAEGAAAGRATDEMLRSIVRNNPDMQRAILALDRLGVSFDQVAAAAGGSEADLSDILARLDQEIATLGDKWQKEVLKFWDPGKAKGLSDQMNQLREVRKAVAEYAKQLGQADQANDLMNTSTTELRQPHVNLSAVFLDNATKIRALQVLVDAFSNSEATATDRVNALRQAVELQTGSAINANEADERFQQALVNLTAQVKNAKAAGDDHAASMSKNTEAGLRNRDAIEEAALAARDLYLQDIASGVPMDEATRKHHDRIKALQKEAEEAGLSKTETDELIKTYGDVPDKVETTFKTKNFDQVFEELAQLKFIQDALAQGMSLEEARHHWKIKKWMQGPMFFAPGSHPGGDGPGVKVSVFSSGGRASGPGTATSDSILARLSNGEFVQPAAAVDYYGQGFMEAIRRRLIPREMLPGFARGGLVRFPFTVDLEHTFVPTLDDVVSKVVPAVSAGGIGSADMMRILRRVFPGLPMYSGYRPGSRTASGSLSYHAMIAADGDPGRAVDIPPIRDVFNWIHDHYFRQTRELIWLGDKYRNIWNGRHHKFSDALLRQHGVAGMPNAHIHWAMDSGGMLQPGWNPPIWNGTGKPEPVLTDQQWRQIARAARGGDSPSTVNQYNFRDTTLTPQLLQAIQDRQRAQELLARPGRPR